MDILAKDLGPAAIVNDMIGSKCCSQRLKDITLPAHPDWMYVLFTCKCKEQWRIWQVERELKTAQN